MAMKLLAVYRDGRVTVQSARHNGKQIKKMIFIIKHILDYVKPTVSVIIICGKYRIYF